VADHWGILQAATRRAGTPLPAVDAMLAATASAYDLTIVTRNERDLTSSSVAVLNPWHS
jgi:predicted nucleic acid-binding protein